MWASVHAQEPFTRAHPAPACTLPHVAVSEGDRRRLLRGAPTTGCSKIGRSFSRAAAGTPPRSRHHQPDRSYSYKRLWGGAEAIAGQGGEALYVCWGHNTARPGPVPIVQAAQGRLDPHRVSASLDSACNPYLAFASILAPGVKGIEESYELRPPPEDNVWTLTRAERRALGIQLLARLAQRRTSRSWSAASWWPRRWRARLRLLPAQQAQRVGREYRATSTEFELGATCPCSDCSDLP
ncbi:hypothetical protein [Nonomuraea rubra]|uniref:hypothetical protein n=1 Tax=Nonomuraea rubra TaxID=46180 RepID=UPI0031F02107